MVPRSSGLLVPWSRGLVISWSPGLLVLWSPALVAPCLHIGTGQARLFLFRLNFKGAGGVTPGRPGLYDLYFVRVDLDISQSGSTGSPGTRYLFLLNKKTCLFCYQVPGARYLLPGTWQVSGTWYQLPGVSENEFSMSGSTWMTLFPSYPRFWK